MDNLEIAGLEGVWIFVYMALLLVPLAALVDTVRHRADEWAQADSSKVTWIIGLIVGLVFCAPIGALLGLLYFATAGRQLSQIRRDS
jgi:hypothetical protein